MRFAATFPNEATLLQSQMQDPRSLAQYLIVVSESQLRVIALRGGEGYREDQSVDMQQWRLVRGNPSTKCRRDDGIPESEVGGMGGDFVTRRDSSM